jgi:hypothetical protein
MCVFLWAKGLNANYIHKEMFPVYGGKCLPRKVFHNWVEKFSPGRSKVADDAQPGAEVAENSRKTSMLRVSTHWESDGASVSVLVEDMSRNKCVFQDRISHVTYLLTLPHIS